MSEGDGFFKRMLAPRQTSMPIVDTKEAKGLMGRLDSYSSRKSAEFVEKEKTAARRAFEAATELNLAREEYLRVSSRMTPDHFQVLAMQEQMRVKEEFLAQELRLAEAEKQKQHFELRAKAEAARLRADLRQAELAEKQAERALYGLDQEAETNEQQSKEEKRGELTAQLNDVQAKIDDVDLEHAQKVAADELDETTEQRIQLKRNRLLDEYDRIQAELDEL